MTAITIPRLRSELLSSTALTPTQHKGGIASLIGIVASIAIPFAAPMIAGSLMASMGIAATATAMTVGSAMVGAAMGAGLAAATGGNPLMGAIGGGIGGGIGGFNAPIGGAAPSISTPNFTGPGVGTLAMPAAGSVPVGGATAGLAGAGAVLVPSGGFLNAASGAGSFVPGAGSGVTVPSFAGVYNAPTAATSSGGLLSSGSTTAASAGLNTATGAGTANFNPNLWGGSIPAPAPSLLTKAGNFLGELPGKFLSSEGAQQAAGKLVTQGLSNYLTGDEPDMSNEEKARMADLEAARATQKGLLDQKQKVSQQYVQAAANINPEYYGQQALTEEQNRLLRAQQAGLRGINPSSTGARLAQTQRNALDKSRLSGYDRGRQEAEAKRLQYMSAAQNSAPSGNTFASAAASDLAAADARYKRLEGAGQEVRDIFDPLVGEFFGSTKKKKLEEATP